MAVKDFRIAKKLFDQGKLEGLSEGNIEYIKDSLSAVVNLLDAAEKLNAKVQGLNRTSSLLVTEQAEKLKQDVQRTVDNTIKNFDTTEKGGNKNNKEYLDQIALVMQKIRNMEAEIDNLKTKNNELEEKLDSKLENHAVLLENKLQKLTDLTSEEKSKLITYFKEFARYLEQNYVASLSIASGKIDAHNFHEENISNNIVGASKLLAPNLANETAHIITNIGSKMPFIGPVFEVLKLAMDFVDTQKATNQAEAMAKIAHNIAAFDDLVGHVAVQITIGKRKEILSAQNDVSTSGFFRFLKGKKDLVDKKFLDKIDNTPEYLKPVIKMAAKDATMVVAACIKSNFSH